MAVAFVGVGSIADAVSPSTSLAVTAPTASVGDLLILHVSYNDFPSSFAPEYPSVPSGWNLIHQWSFENGFGNEYGRIAMFWRIADGTANDSPTVSWSTAPDNGLIGYITAYSGADATSPINASANTFHASSGHTWPQVASAANGFAHLTAASYYNGSGITATGGYTERLDSGPSGSAEGRQFLQTKATTGATTDASTLSGHIRLGYSTITIAPAATGSTVTGSGSPQAETATGSGAGSRVITGSGSPQANAATSSASGERESHGSGALQAAAATSSGVGERIVVGSGAPQAETATSVGSGGATGTVAGSGASQADTATSSGVGSRIITGSGANQADIASGSGAGARVIAGSGSPQANAATSSASGERESHGSGALQAAAATSSGAGFRKITGSGALQASISTSSGAGSRVIAGSGANQAETATIQAYAGSSADTVQKVTVFLDDAPVACVIDDRVGSIAIPDEYSTVEI